MIKRMMFSVFVLVVFSGDVPAFSAEIEPVSSIQNIVVYPDSALIKKQSVFPVTKGQNIIRFSGITSNMVDASVQTGFRGGAGVRIADVKVEKTYLAETRREKTETLKIRLEHLEEAIKARTNEITVLNNSTDFLKKIVPFPQNRKTTPSEVDAHLKFFARSLSENYEKIAKAESKLKKLEEEKKAVERELNNLSSLAGESKSIVVSAFAQDDHRKVTMVFSYLVRRAGWSPQYDLRADSAAHVAINCLAVIHQFTGEDWTGINLEVSTAKPFVYGAPPELTPWYVDIYQPRPRMLKSALRNELDGFQPTMAMKEKRQAEPESGYEMPQVKAETSSFSFVLPGKVDVPSDNQPHKILIASAGKDSKWSYYAVPKLSKYSYLRADFKNPFPFPLIEGPMSVFLDNRLVGTASLNKTILADENMSLSLGVDEGIKVEKKPVKKFTEYAGAFTKETRVHYEYVIDITNGKNRDIALTVNDNVPVSRNEKIKVEIESPKKEAAKISEDGVITWDLKLAKGEKKSLKIDFTVEYPKNLRITGLE